MQNPGWRGRGRKVLEAEWSLDQKEGALQRWGKGSIGSEGSRMSKEVLGKMEVLP